MKDTATLPCPPSGDGGNSFVANYMKLVGIAGTIAYFTKLGFPVPVITAWFITLLELIGGIALILGCSSAT